ncbi:putative sulfate exporter family transporter [Alloscardovia theropitheci]|uniref:Putative sulfate exporter family transporter n=1 Tax=Alloscardovia theropitheci TaxID=2496842 RepID=A0A4V2MTU8_9BIFI|nr:putative sulfate exporter family transporter [Alloscardovia theropitheci]TCD53919.1 putative sulfate exporter family transporter [Alloscardovia theropitheci]
MQTLTHKITQLLPGILISCAIGVIAWGLGRLVPVIGGPIFAIIIGMIIALWWKDKGKATPGISFTSKYILQTAVVLLGFGLDLGVIAATGWQSLPIIIVTISTALLLGWAMKYVLNMSSRVATLVAVGSSICGGSAIAATAPVIDADDEEVAQSISVIFLFNVIAALLFPVLGHALGMSTTRGEAFGIFSGTAVNDTSSVTAAASTWDTMWNLGSATLDKAVTVKLTRTLAIIPITLVLSIITARAHTQLSRESFNIGSNNEASTHFSLKRAFPQFIAWFVLASLITTVAIRFGVSASSFNLLKELSKFFIIMAMSAIGLNSNVVKLIKTAGKPLALGAVCWIGITVMSLIMMHSMRLL